VSAVLAVAAADEATTWELKLLAEVADILDGKRIPVNAKEREKRPGRVPYYGATGQVGWIDDFLFDEELVLLGEDGAPFLDPSKPKAYVIRGKSWVNNHAHVLRARGVPTGWLAHYLNAVGYDELVTGTTRLKLTQAAMRQIRVPVAPWHVMQQCVAEIEKQFSRLDEAVVNLTRVITRLASYRERALADAFACEPNTTIGELISEGPQNGLYLPKDAYGSGTPIVRIDDYQTDWMRPVAELRRVRAAESQASTWALQPGDLLVNRVNSMSHLGKCIVIPAPLSGALFESNMMRLRLAPGVLPRYVELYLGSRIGKRRLTSNAKWAVNQASINQKDVLATEIPLTSLERQGQTVAEVDRCLSIVREVEVEVDANLKRAGALRQAVLARAYQTSPVMERGQ
jgi:type I restriction enzyme S subunit